MFVLCRVTPTDNEISKRLFSTHVRLREHVFVVFFLLFRK
jgi:hypothetical protein